MTNLLVTILLRRFDRIRLQLEILMMFKLVGIYAMFSYLHGRGRYQIFSPKPISSLLSLLQREKCMTFRLPIRNLGVLTDYPLGFWESLKRSHLQIHQLVVVLRLKNNVYVRTSVGDYYVLRIRPAG